MEEKQPASEEKENHQVISSADTPVSTDHRAKRKKFLINSFLIVLIISLVIGIFVYYQFLNSPKMIIRDTFKKFEKITSVGYSVKMEMEVNQDVFGKDFMTPIAAREYIGFGITLDGALDMKDIEEVKSLMNVHIVTYGQGKDSLEIDAETRTIGDNLYIMLTKLPASVGVPFSYLKDEWIHVNVHDMQKKYALPITKDDKALTEEQEKRIQMLFQNSDLFTIKEKGDEMINDIDAYHYAIEFNKYELRNALKEFYRIAYEGELSRRERQEMGKAFDKMVVKDTELWIGKKDHMLYRINTTIVFDTKDGDVAVPLKIRLKDHNEPVSVKKPRDARDFEEIMQDIIQQYYYEQLQSQYKSNVFPSRDRVLGARIGQNPAKDKEMYRDITEKRRLLESGIKGRIISDYLLKSALSF